MSKWGVPQLATFTGADLVGKAWKTVETSIDKAIGIPSSDDANTPTTTSPSLNSRSPAGSPYVSDSKRPPSSPAQTGSRDNSTSTPPPTRAPATGTPPHASTPPPGTPPPSSTPPPHARTPTTPGRTTRGSTTAGTSESISLEALLNSPILEASKDGPKITPKHSKRVSQSLETQSTINSEEPPNIFAKNMQDASETSKTPETSKTIETSKTTETTISQEITNVAPAEQSVTLSSASEPLSPPLSVILSLSSSSSSISSMANDQVSHSPRPHNPTANTSHSPEEDNGPTNHHPTTDPDQSSKSLDEDDANPLHDLSQTEATTAQEQDEGGTSITRSSSSSSLMEMGSDASELELKAKIIELNGKIAAIAIIEREKDRQLDEKTKQLAIREKQLESAMERQAALSAELQNVTEEVEKLRTKSSSSSSSSSASTNDIVESLKEEFSRRLGTTEKKLQAVTRERDELKKGQSMGDQAKGVVKAKDDEINTLRAEGTNLSLKILNLESALKKYRASKKEDDANILALREKLTQTETLLEKRNDRVKQLEFSEKKYLETITTMKDVSDNAAKKLEKKELELSLASKQVQELQSNLDKAMKELQGAKKSTQEAGDKYLSEVEDAKKSVAQEYQTMLNKKTAELQATIAAHEATIAELRNTLSSSSDQAGKKEDSLLKEILHLRTCLDQAEKRNEEIMQSIPDSTRPLLRQIEALQALLENKTRTADALERDLRARLADEEARCIAALEKDRTSSSALSEMTHRVTLLETQYEDEHILVSRLRTEVETLKLDEKKYKRLATELGAKLAAAELQEDRLTAELRQGEERHQRTISAMKELEEALNKSREKEKEAREELNKLHRFGPSPNGSYNMRRSNSTHQDLAASPLLSHNGPSSSSSPSSSLSSSTTTSQQHNNQQQLGNSTALRDPSSLPLVERLQAMLGQRDGEIAVMQSQLSSLEAARKELQEELAAITSKNEMLTHTDEDLQAVQAQLKELQTKFSTALQLVGEKEEQVMELKMDIQDLKEMYRTQISELIEQNERLQKKK